MKNLGLGVKVSSNEMSSSLVDSKEKRGAFKTMPKHYLRVGVFAALWVLPASGDDLASIKHALDAKYALTTTTADRRDIVAAGSLLVLKKSNLLTMEATKPLLLANSYKNGRITQAKLISISMKGNGIEGARTFVSGEKVWLTDIEIKEKEVSFQLYSDAINDVHYRCKLNFPLEKDETPTVAGVTAAVAEVFEIQPADAGNNGGAQGQQPPPQQQYRQPQAAAPPPAPEAPPPPIAPPPPPPADPTQVKLGQTPAQVVASLGQPDKVLKAGAKQTYVYQNMKVVFTAGKVSDVQ